MKDIMPDVMPKLSDGEYERLGSFYMDHPQLWEIPFARFVWQPLAWCQRAGIESPDRWRPLREPNIQPEAKVSWFNDVPISMAFLVFVGIIFLILLASGMFR